MFLGNGQSVKYGALGGKLGAALGSDGLHAVAGFNSAYIGASLIGAFISSDAATAGTNVSKVAAALRNVTVSAEEVASAKKVAAVEISEMAMNPMMQVSFHHEFYRQSNLHIFTETPVYLITKTSLLLKVERLRGLRAVCKS